MNASLNLATQQIDADGGNKMNIPVIVINNEDYDEDQDQKPVERLPITEELIFLRYQDGADEESHSDIHGFVFYYPSLDICKVIECEVTS